MPTCLSRVGSRKLESLETICRTFEGSRESDDATACMTDRPGFWRDVGLASPTWK